MNAKQSYREFSEHEPTLPIFSRGWWLDATAGHDGWDVALVQKGGEIIASMPYLVSRRFGMTLSSQPPLTQKLGPWIRPSDGKPATRLGRENELMQALIEQLPEFDHFSQNWDHARTNWLPFCWNGFQQTTRYTYVLPELRDTDRLWAGFGNTTRAECKKASERFGLQMRDDLPLDALLKLNRMTLSRQGIAVPYSDEFVRRLDAACAERGCGKFIVAVDAEGRQHAANYFVWDENSAYGLINGTDPALRNSGAASLCIWKVIQHAATVTGRFDFTGSMMEPIERFFRGFGAIQVPYFNVSRTSSLLLRARRGLLDSMKRAPRGK